MRTDISPWLIKHPKSGFRFFDFDSLRGKGFKIGIYWYEKILFDLLPIYSYES